MIEDGFYIGFVKDRFFLSPVNRIVVVPLLEWDEKRSIWIDISQIRSRQIFPDKGMLVSFINDENLLENQVLKFKVRQNPKYTPGNFLRHAKFSVDRNHYILLWELLSLDFKGSESELREVLINGKIHYDKPYNSECLIALDKNRWLGLLKFQLNNPVSKLLIPVNPENWRKLEVRQIEENDKIKSIYLHDRVFLDPERNFTRLVNLENWQPKATFVKRLINRLREYLEKSKSNTPSLDLHEFGKLVRQNKIDKTILHRLQEHENMNNLQQEDISAIVQLLMATEPFQHQLEAAKELHLEKCRRELRTQAQQEKSGLEDQIADLQQQVIDIQQEINQEKEDVKSKIVEKTDLENEIQALKNQADQLEKSFETQKIRIYQVLNEFEHLLEERFNQLAVEPPKVLAEALANDIFLQFLLGRDQRQLKLGSSPRILLDIPKFAFKQGAFFDNAETLIAEYRKRLDRTDLDESLAVWTIAISLSGIMPVLKGGAVKSVLNVFKNHLTYGRHFTLPLSPEIISIERLFSVGQSGNLSNFGIFDTAILCAKIHQEALFILVLEGLDRAPSQYFLDTLIDEYWQGFQEAPSDTFLSERLEKLWAQHRIREQYALADDKLGWPANLLLVATINGLADGFPVSNALQGKIMEINVHSQGKYLDIHPRLIDQIACKLVGEVTAHQWRQWREKSESQDLTFISEFIASLPENKQPDIIEKQTILQIFSALITLKQSQNDAINIIQKYLLESK